MSILTFKTRHWNELSKVCFDLKSALGNFFAMETLCTEFIFSPLKNQSIEFTHQTLLTFANLNLADFRASSDIDLLTGSD